MTEERRTLTAEQRFGVRVRRARESLRWTQAELAKRLSDEGVVLHASAIAKIEGATRAVRINEAAAIARLIGASLDELSRPPTDEWQEVLDTFREALKMHRDAEKMVTDGFDLIRSIAGDFSGDAPVARAAPELQPALLQVLAALDEYSGHAGEYDRG